MPVPARRKSEVGQVGVAADLGVEADRGVVARSDAMMSAAPRKKVNGETSIRPIGSAPVLEPAPGSAPPAIATGSGREEDFGSN